MFSIQAIIEYLKTQFSVKRRRDVAELYTRKYQDIIRDQCIEHNQLRTHTPLESIPEYYDEDNDSTNDVANNADSSTTAIESTLYDELSAYANSISTI